MGENVNVKPKGTTLFTEKPFAHCLDTQFAEERCDYCLNKPEDPRACTGCNYVHYCNEKCQKEAWKLYHKYECKIIKVHRAVVNAHPTFLLFLRIWNKLKRGGREERVYYTNKDFRTFDDMMTHKEEIMADTVSMMLLKAITKSFKDVVKGIDGEVIAEIYCKYQINGFDILSDKLRKIASGLYLGCSTIDHSCNPNCNYIFHGTTIEVRNIRDIPNYTWNKVTLTYKGPLNVRETRRKLLKETFFFHCECERCLDDDVEKMMNSMQCPNDNCKAAIYVNKDIAEKISCHNCHADIPMTRIEEYLKVMEFCDDMFKLDALTGREPEYDLPSYERFMNMQTGLLHRLNINSVKVMLDAFESAVDLELNIRAQKYGAAALEGAKKYYGEYFYVVAGMYIELMQTALDMGNMETASIWYVKGLETTKISLGEKHKLYGVLKESYRFSQMCHMMNINV